MAMLVVDGYGSFEIPEGIKLVRAIVDAGVYIMRSCDGNAKCTTCRVKLLAGEPEIGSAAEIERLSRDGLLGQVRLSCQCRFQDGMHVRPLNTLSYSDHDDPGSTPKREITQDPEWDSMKMTE
jgi:ferredoxin